MNSKIIVALDYDNEAQAWAFIEKVTPDLCRLKIGKELFCATGKNFVERVVKQGFDVFLDLKFHDIPNTVSSVLKVVADMGVWMVNVHAFGGEKMLLSATNTLAQYTNAPILIGVTVLTSMADDDLSTLGVTQSVKEQVINLAKLTKKSGLQGVVCSANEVVEIKQNLGDDFLTITPGIRPKGTSLDDQNRIMTPERAISIGSDFLVIGRPITKAEKPIQVLRKINDSINKMVPRAGLEPARYC